uniref:ribonuclease H n=1 Tax=Oryzias latipes TaxID=8090 RepID=A0A3B3H9G5_ORYLA
LLVSGREVLFLCDSGATKTTLNFKLDDMTFSGKTITVRSANGELTKEKVTDPLLFVDPVSNLQTELSAIYCSSCPVNLLGRDAAFDLHLAVGRQGDDYRVIRQTPPQQLVWHEDGGDWQGTGILYAYRLIPETLWSAGPSDVGLIKDVAPVVITPKSGFRPYVRQYPLKPDAVAGIRPMIESFLKSGVIIECSDSPVNTPIFPVPKAPPSVGWRLVQDLQAVNSNVISRAPLVPDPHTLLNDLHPQNRFFTVVDLANAFFSIPVSGKRLTFARLPQGFTDSPCIFSMAMSANLSKFQPPGGSQILLYIDDILLASPTEDICLSDSIALLHFLHSQGHKCSKSKIQLAKTQVKFLGHLVSASAQPRLLSRNIPLTSSLFHLCVSWCMRSGKCLQEI